MLEPFQNQVFFITTVGIVAGAKQVFQGDHVTIKRRNINMGLPKKRRARAAGATQLFTLTFIFH